MATIPTVKRTASLDVNTVCAEVEELGVIKTKYGTKPMVKIAFETDELNEYGTKRRLTRLFHKHTHEKSSLSIAAKAWCNRDLAAEEENLGEIDLQSFVGVPARLKLKPGAVIDGKQFMNIEEILPIEDDARDADTTCDAQATN